MSLIDREIELLGYLRQLQSVCTFCLSHDVDDSKHSILECPTVGSPDAYQAWRSLIRYKPRMRVCYICHVPQGAYDSLHPTFTGNYEQCEFRDTIAPLVYGILISDDLRAEVQQHFQLEGITSPMMAMDWINGEVVLGYHSNVVALFLWYCSTYMAS